MELDAFVSIFANAKDDIIKKLDGLSCKPIHRIVGGSATSTSLTAPLLVTANPRPAAGRVWFVEKVGVFGSDGHTAVGGALADVYAGPGQDPDFSAQIYSGLLVPSIVIEGSKRNPLHPQETLYAWFYSVPANQQVSLTGTCYDFPIEAVEALTI